MRKSTVIVLTMLISVMLSACSPEVGSQAWCENLADKAKGEWTANEATYFAEHCMFGNYKKG